MAAAAAAKAEATAAEASSSSSSSTAAAATTAGAPKEAEGAKSTREPMYYLISMQQQYRRTVIHSLHVGLIFENEKTAPPTFDIAITQH